VSGEPKTLTQMTPREAWETAWEQAIDTARVVMEEETVAKQLEAMRNLSRQFIDQEPEGVPVVARDEAAELRAENECLRQDRQPDYLYNPTDWEYTVPWCDRHLFDAEIGDADGAVRYRTAYDGPDVFAADVPIEFDDAGCPVRSEIQWFDSQEAAEEALLRVAAPEEQP